MAISNRPATWTAIVKQHFGELFIHPAIMYSTIDAIDGIFADQFAKTPECNLNDDEFFLVPVDRVQRGSIVQKPDHDHYFDVRAAQPSTKQLKLQKNDRILVSAWVQIDGSVNIHWEFIEVVDAASQAIKTGAPATKSNRSNPTPKPTRPTSQNPALLRATKPQQVEVAQEQEAEVRELVNA